MTDKKITQSQSEHMERKNILTFKSYNLYSKQALMNVRNFNETRANKNEN